MNYTHEEIINALTVIKGICDVYAGECNNCPFFVGEVCYLTKRTPYTWVFAEEIWRAFR